MPKVEIDYSNTIIYKITCNDSKVVDKYVGHTTNFVQRKHSHKNSTNNNKSPCYNLKLYKTIRDNGGWDNWKMEIVQFYNCKNIYEAKMREQSHYTQLNASLNSIEPFKPIETTVERERTKIKQDDDVSSGCCEVSKSNYNCEKCNYRCDSKKDFNKHMSTTKHKKNTDLKNVSKIYICQFCNNEYKHQSSLCKHSHNCNTEPQPSIDQPSSNITALTNSVIELVKVNSELQKQVLELQKQSHDFQKQLLEICKNK